MIKKLSIVKLFDQFDYEINFAANGITILTGPNGYGKSTILKIIEFLGEQDLLTLSQLNFDEIYLELASGKQLTIKKENEQLIVNGVSLKLFNKRDIIHLERRTGIPFIERIGPNEYLDVRKGRILSLSEMREMRSIYQIEKNEGDKLISANIALRRNLKKTHDDIKDLKSLHKEMIQIKRDIGSIKFIKEQRLIRKELAEDDEDFYSNSREVAIEVITEIPENIKNEIRQVVLQYSQEASQLDSSFPERLFNTSGGVSEQEYVDLVSELILKQEKFQDYKLLKDAKTISPAAYNYKFSEALKVYLKDTRKKLEVFDPLVEKIDLFTSIVNKKLNFKKVLVSGDNGLEVKHDDGRLLDLTSLSSGEQQIIVLYYDLIFGLHDKSILLIDEPEISLHVAWQMELLDDFQKILNLKNKNLSIVIATHAPQVIGNHWDLVIDLGEEYNENK